MGFKDDLRQTDSALNTSPKTIFFDMDGVLNNLSENLVSYIKYYYPEAVWDENPYGYDMTKWFSIKGMSGKHLMHTVFSDSLFWRNLTRNEKLYSEMEDMAIYDRNNVYVCTSPFGWGVCPSEKEDWLKKYYPKINTTKNLIMMKDKELLATNGILIDDYPDNVRKFMDAGGEAYLYETFYNYAEDLPKIKSLHELEGYI